MVVNQGGKHLPDNKPFTEYSAEIAEDRLICKKGSLSAIVAEIPYSAFQSAEFGIGSGNLWLQCVVDGSPLVFCSPRKCWMSDAGKLLIEKIGQHTEIRDLKEYKHYTGKLFFLYMFK